MFDHNPELSPDLVWLLQSQPVEDGLLARMLVEESYAQLISFWEALLGDPQKAQDAAIETFSTALLKTSTFHEPQSVRAWLTGLAVELYRKERQKAKQDPSLPANKGMNLQQLSPASRLAAVLRFRLDYTTDEVAQFLGENLSATETRLWAARQLLLNQTGRSDLGGGHAGEAEPLAQAFQQAYPTPAFSEVDLELISQEVIGRARKRRSHLQRRAYWKEISLISAVILVVLVWMGRAHLDAPETTPTPPAGMAQAASTRRPTEAPTATHRARPTNAERAATRTTTLPPAQWTPTPIPEDAFYVVQEGDTLWGIAINLGTSVEALRSLNRIAEGDILQPGQLLLKPGNLALDTPAPTSLPIKRQSSPTPLPRPRSVEEILQRRGIPYMYNMWWDAHVIYRGPQGYLGEVQTFRMQVWFSWDGLLLLTGPDQGAPAKAFKVKPGEENGIYIAQPDIGKPWFEYSASSDEFSTYFQIFTNILNLQIDHWADKLVNTVLVGSGKVQDHQAYILKQFDPQQRLLRTIWLDAESSEPLRIQIHDPNDARRVTTEILATGLEFNADIPQALFNPQIPWLSGYAKSSRGDPFAPGEDLLPWKDTPAPSIAWPYTPVPPNLSLATSRLQFQFGQIFPLFPDQNSQVHYRAEIFAGSKYLGLATLPNPFFTLCARSPDGRRMAYAPAGTSTLDIFSGNASPGGPIRWIDLMDPGREYSPAPNLQAYSFAFSPDGEQLAVYGKGDVPGIYVVDLKNEQARFLEYANLAYSLVWSPDGKQLAYISQSAGPPSDHASLVVLEVESSKVVSRQSFPTPGDPPSKNVLTQPPLQWGVPFPVGMGDLGACAARPVGK